MKNWEEIQREALGISVQMYQMARKLSFRRYLFHLYFSEDTWLPPYKGSTIRGALMKAFQEFVCFFKDPHCKDCMLGEQCYYIRFFERTEPPIQRQTWDHHFQTMPFVLEVPQDGTTFFPRDSRLSFGLTLLDETQDMLPLFINACHLMGEKGIGSGLKQGKGKFVLDEVVSLGRDKTEQVYNHKKIHDWKAGCKNPLVHFPFVVEGTQDIRIECMSPIRLKEKGSLKGTFDFARFFHFLLSRFFRMYEDASREKLSYPLDSIEEIAKSIQSREDQLYWFDWERYSNRQKTKMNMGGVMGSIVFEKVPSYLLWLFELGQEAHVGKNTTLGLGQYSYHVQKV